MPVREATAYKDRAGGLPIEPTAVYSIADVEALLNVSRKTVLRLIEEKKLPASRVGRQYRIPGAFLLEFLARTATDPESAEDALVRYIPSPASLLLVLRRASAPAAPEEQAIRDAIAGVARVRRLRR